MSSSSLAALIVLVPRVDRPELAPVDGQQLAPEQLQLAAEHRELPRHRPQRLEIVLPEIRDGLEVRCQLAQQPDHFHIPLTLRFQQPAGPNPMQITIQVEFEQVRQGYTADDR